MCSSASRPSLDLFQSYGDHSTTVDLLTAALAKELKETGEEIAANFQRGLPVNADFFLQPTANRLNDCIAFDLTRSSGRGGQCRGASEWLIICFLYFRKIHPEIPTLYVLQALTKKYEDRVGPPEALLQKFQGRISQEVMGRLVQFELEQERFELKSSELWGSPFFTKQPDESIAIFLNQMLKLKEGIYLCSIPGGSQFLGFAKKNPGHAIVILIEKEDYYLFDLNYGLIRVSRNSDNSTQIEELENYFFMFLEYSPLGKAKRAFSRGLDKLSKIFKSGEEVLIREKALLLLERNPDYSLDGAFLAAPPTVHLITYCKQELGIPISEEQESKILKYLCIGPATQKISLQLGDPSLKLKKVVPQ